MRMTAIGLLAMALAGCSIADRYGNEYGDWYNPGSNYIWQLGLCEHQMEARSVPAPQRKAAMRCCMRDHGVPVGADAGCAGTSG